MNEFVHRQNLMRFAELLDGELDGDRRRRLEGLLLEEENQLGVCRERVGDVDRLIIRSTARVLAQEQLVVRLRQTGGDPLLATELLATMTKTLEFLRRRRLLLEGSPGSDATVDQARPGA
jgi:hypothetical protein